MSHIEPGRPQARFPVTSLRPLRKGNSMVTTTDTPPYCPCDCDDECGEIRRALIQDFADWPPRSFESRNPWKAAQTSRIEVWNITNGYCAYCRKDLRAHNFYIDHVHPKSKGGADSFDNYLPACRSCNLSKGNTPLKAFLERRISKNAKTYRKPYHA